MPTAVSIFGGERVPFPKPPRELAERYFAVTAWAEHDRGGHFPAVAEPALLAQTLRDVFRPRAAAHAMNPQLIRYSERPEAWDAFAGLSSEVWPEYNRHGDVLGQSWDQLYETFPEWQFMLLRPGEGQVLAGGHTIPVAWDPATPSGPQPARGRVAGHGRAAAAARHPPDRAGPADTEGALPHSGRRNASIPGQCRRGKCCRADTAVQGKQPTAASPRSIVHTGIAAWGKGTSRCRTSCAPVTLLPQTYAPRWRPVETHRSATQRAWAYARDHVCET